MNAGDIGLSLMIIIIFLIMIGANLISQKAGEIKHNWPKYRCNPLIMPFASFWGHKPAENFYQCIQNIQKQNMPTYLQPMNYAVSLAGSTGKQVTSSVQGIREFMNYLRNQLHTTIRKIFTVFLGIVMPIQEVLLRFRDLTMKLLGSMAVLLYMVDGSNKTVVSTWNSDVGGLVRTLCFDPKTKVKLDDGKFKMMCNINLGDILENGSEVIGTLRLKGGRSNQYYSIYSKKLKQHINITGSHFIQDPKTKRFIPVSEFSEAHITPKTTPYMSCLITSDHQIPIGEYTFWDWEDGDLSP